MTLLFLLASAACGIGGLICSILILIHAFKNSVVQGLLCLCVPCYILYYMFVEFQHPNKGLIIAGALFGNGLSAAFQTLARG